MGLTIGHEITLADDPSKGWNVLTASRDNGTKIGLWGVTGKDNELFNFNPSSGEIRCMGKCVDVPNNDASKNPQLQIYDCNGSAAQKFSYTTVDGPIKHVSSGKCVDLHNNNRTNGTDIRLQDCNNASAQNWYVGSQDAPQPKKNWTIFEHGDYQGNWATRSPDDPPCSQTGVGTLDSVKGRCTKMPCANNMPSCWGFGGKTSSLKVDPGVVVDFFQHHDYGGWTHRYEGGENGLNYANVRAHDAYWSYKSYKDCKHPSLKWDKDCENNADNTLNGGCNPGSVCFENRVKECSQDVNSKRCLEFCKANPDKCKTSLAKYCATGDNITQPFCKNEFCPKYPGTCDQAAADYCKRNPNNMTFCGCYNNKPDPNASAKVLQMYTAPYCYLQSCSGNMEAYMPANFERLRSSCTGITICDSEINQTAGGQAAMSGIVVVQNCGNDNKQPATPTTTTTTPTTTIPTIPTTSTDTTIPTTPSLNNGTISANVKYLMILIVALMCMFSLCTGGVIFFM